MLKTLYSIPKMDCAAEEELIRLRLEDVQHIQSLNFDLPARRLAVYHTGDDQAILAALSELNLGAAWMETAEAEPGRGETSGHAERRMLVQVLAINLFFFFLESLSGFLSDSMGLVADSLDMLADSLVYALALFAVGGTASRKRRIARASGYFQLALALLGLVEVVRRALGFGEVPVFQTMIAVSTLALVGNAASLILLQRSRSREAHIQASLIFTSNDVIINLGVIAAGVLVLLTRSNLPDLAIGAVVFLLVSRGAFRILRLGR